MRGESTSVGQVWGIGKQRESGGAQSGAAAVRTGGEEETHMCGAWRSRGKGGRRMPRKLMMQSGREVRSTQVWKNRQAEALPRGGECCGAYAVRTGGEGGRCGLEHKCGACRMNQRQQGAVLLALRTTPNPVLQTPLTAPLVSLPTVQQQALQVFAVGTLPLHLQGRWLSPPLLNCFSNTADCCHKGP